MWWHDPLSVRYRNCLATPLVICDKVVTAIGRFWVVGLDARSGEELWRTRIPAHPSFDITERDGLAYVGTHQSILALNPDSGQVVLRHTWARSEIRSIAISNRWLVVGLTDEFRFRKHAPEHIRPSPNLRLLVTNSVDRFVLPYGMYAGPQIRWCESTQRIYESTQYGLGIVNPIARKRVAKIEEIEIREKMYGDYDNRTSLPLALGDRLYFLSRSSLIAARNPAL
jgi:hypothetical protein